MLKQTQQTIFSRDFQIQIVDSEERLHRSMNFDVYLSYYS